MNTILLIEDDQSLNTILTHYIKKYDFQVLSYTDPYKFQTDFKNIDFEVAILDVNLGDVNGFSILQKILDEKENTMCIMITAYGNISDTKKALKMGAYDYLTKPFKEIELIHHIKNALKSINLEKENLKLKKKLSGFNPDHSIIGSSEAIKKTKSLIRNLAENNVNVMITGETGTGKEVAARAIHNLSSRSSSPFIAINCAAIPENLLESELFGHKKGTFTGAMQDKKGKFEMAHKGTIFLDEIAEMPMALQSKLLRAVQEKEIEPLGSNTPIKIDVTFISATNKDIELEVKEKRFREDLYYRLNIFPIKMPPLRNHLEDIPQLIKYFNEETYNNKLKISKEALKLFNNYNWPGNVRELENVLNYSYVCSQGKEIKKKHLPEKLFQDKNEETYQSGKEKTLAEHEKAIITAELEKNHWNQTKTAEKLGITRSVLLYKLKNLSISTK